MCATTAGLGAATYLAMTLTPARPMDSVPFAASPSDSPTAVAIGDTLGQQADAIHVATSQPGPNTTTDTTASQLVAPAVSTSWQATTATGPTRQTGPSEGESVGLTGCHPAGTASHHPIPMAVGLATAATSRPLCQVLSPDILVLPPVVIPVELLWKLLSSQTVPSIKLPTAVPATSGVPADALASLPASPAALNQMPLVAAPESVAPAQVPTPVASSAPFPNVDSPASPIAPSRTPPSPTTPAPITPSPTSPLPNASSAAAPSPAVPPHAVTLPAVTPPSVTPPAVPASPIPQQRRMPVH